MKGKKRKGKKRKSRGKSDNSRDDGIKRGKRETVSEAELDADVGTEILGGGVPAVRQKFVSVGQTPEAVYAENTEYVAYACPQFYIWDSVKGLHPLRESHICTAIRGNGCVFTYSISSVRGKWRFAVQRVISVRWK